jgi:hypothetical protein
MKITSHYIGLTLDSHTSHHIELTLDSHWESLHFAIAHTQAFPTFERPERASMTTCKNTIFPTRKPFLMSVFIGKIRGPF